MAEYLSLDDFEVQARKKLPKSIYGFIAGAAETGASVRDNAQAFEDYSFLPNVLRDVSSRTQEVRLWDESYSAPFGIAPVGMTALAAYRSDISYAKASLEANIPMIVSGTALIRLEEIKDVNPKAWFQMYIAGDPVKIKAMLERVAAAGYDTLVLTVDVPTQANRENAIRAGFRAPLKPSLRLALDGLSRPSWLFCVLGKTLWRHGIPHFENYLPTRGVPIISRSVERDFSRRDHLNWEHLKEIRRLWRGQLIVKGVLSPADALLCQDCGADGIILSNHGGRQLDGAVSPLRMLGPVRESTSKLQVMIDSGFRRGSDVLKAMALGADLVFIGRPFAYAAAAAGETGPAKAIAILKEEIFRNMALIGVTTLGELGSQHLLERPHAARASRIQ